MSLDLPALATLLGTLPPLAFTVVPILKGIVMGLFVLTSVLLMTVILLQEGKGGGIAGAFGGAAADTFGVKAGSVNRFTAILATVFVGLALLHAGLAASSASVIPVEAAPEPPAPPPPAEPVVAPALPPAMQDVPPAMPGGMEDGMGAVPAAPPAPPPAAPAPGTPPPAPPAPPPAPPAEKPADGMGAGK